MEINSQRRAFLKKSGLALGGLAIADLSFLINENASHQFKLSLNPGAIGVSLTNDELLEVAISYGFQAIVPNIYEFEKWSNAQINGFQEAMRKNNMVWGAVGLPVEFRASEKKFRSDFGQLSKMMTRLEDLGVTRMSTWIMPTHANLNYSQNMALHAARLREVAQLLKEYNIRLGLEYVGPKTLRESQKYPFVSNLKELKELIKVINETNVGVQLDAFHWYCASESQKDLLSLKVEDIITVDLNDAKAGRTKDEQLDWERELPGASGVIDLKGFLEALVEIGYDGPIRAEPFNNQLNEMNNQDALNATSKAMQQALQLLD